jgi:hypothetical protein
MEERTPMRALIGATLVAAAVAIAAKAAPVAAVLDIGERAVVEVSPGTRVNVRARPEVAADNIISKAPAGALVVVLDREPQSGQMWYRVRALDGAFEGWIRGDLLEPKPDEGARAQTETVAAVQPAAAPPARPRPSNDWSVRLIEFLPAIDSCSNQSSAPPVVVLRARELPLGLVEVFLKDNSARYWSCIVERSGSTPIAWNPVPGPSAFGTDRPNPVFYRHAAAPAPDHCHDVEPVRDERDGTVIGNLVYDLCG